jgi:hypothetical protein
VAALLVLVPLWEWHPAAHQSQTSGLKSLRAWLAAIDQHRPGATDEPLLQFAKWPVDDLEALYPDAVALLEYIKNRGKRRPRRARRDFSLDEAVEIRRIAVDLSQRDANRLARRRTGRIRTHVEPRPIETYALLVGPDGPKMANIG